MIDGKLIIAHRGASFYEKGNTIAAFKRAVELKADMIEFDVRKTKDNKMVIIHDNGFDSKKIKNMTYEEAKAESGGIIPTFEETLKFLSGKTKLAIHLKEDGYMEEAIGLILKYFKKNEIIIFSEISNLLKNIKENYPEIKTGLVMEVGLKDTCLYPWGCFTKNDIMNSKADFVVPRWQLANKAFLKKAKKYSVGVLPWEIKTKELAKKFLKEDSIRGIITNQPDLMNETV